MQSSRLRALVIRMRSFWNEYKKNRLSVLGLGLVISLTLLALFAPFLTSQDPYQISGRQLLPPTWEHLMGTDDLGRDVFVRFLFGSRVSLVVGFTAGVVSTLIGSIVGAISGYYGGLADSLLMRLTELVMVIPRFFLAMLMVAMLGANLFNVIFAISMLSWPPTARLVRAQFLSLKERDFVYAARSVGAPNRTIIFREIFPNAIAPVVVIGTLTIASAILLEAGLSFLGLGDPNLVSWGIMLQYAQGYLRSAWWLFAFPGISIFLTVYGLNLVGDGINDTRNPQLRRARESQAQFSSIKWAT